MNRLSWILLAAFATAAPAQNIQDFFRQSFEERLRIEPETATGVGRYEYDDRWTDWSKTGREQRRSLFEQQLQKLRTFPQASLSAEDRLSARLMEYTLERRLEAFNLEDELFAVMQQNGLHNAVYSTIDRMPARTVKDYENILARLRAAPAYIDQNIAMLDEALPGGMTQPRVVVDMVTQQLSGQIAQDRNTTRLLAAFRSFPMNIPQAEQTRLRAQAGDVYDQRFVPAWRKYRDYLTTKYLPRARTTAGVGGIPNGRAAYEILARFYTTTNTSP